MVRIFLFPLFLIVMEYLFCFERLGYSCFFYNFFFGVVAPFCDERTRCYFSLMTHEMTRRGVIDGWQWWIGGVISGRMKF